MEGSEKQVKCYLGIDIGTTNTKALCVNQDGVVVEILRESTPLHQERGIRLLDLHKLELAVNGFIEHVHSKYRLKGVCFTSIGESIIPVRSGRAMADPLLWYEQVTNQTARVVYPQIRTLVDYGTTGVGNDSTLGLYKLLWMKERQNLDGAEYWLPVSSYFIYRYTGKAVWDYSQAGRSYALDIHKRCWNEQLLSRFGLQNSFGELRYMGEPVAEDNRGVRYFLGGHDHISGLNFVRELFGRQPFIYDSVGSSAFTVTLAEEAGRELHFTESFMKPNGIIGAGFRDGQYYLQNSIRYAGKLLEALARLTGARETSSFYDRANRQIRKRHPWKAENCLFVTGGDLNGDLQGNSCSLLNIPMDADVFNLVHSAYLYLCTMTRLIVTRLREYICGEFIFFTGGGMIQNSLLMEYKATLLGLPVYMMDIGELSALGAVLCVLHGLEQTAVMKKIVSDVHLTRINPDGELQRVLPQLSAVMVEQYRSLKRDGSCDVMQMITDPALSFLGDGL